MYKNDYLTSDEVTNKTIHNITRWNIDILWPKS